MKKQLKSLLTFIIIMLSISYLHAQCPGNKVQMFKPTHSGCISKCVPPNKVYQYANQGWLIFCPNSGGWGFAKTPGKTNNEILSNVKQQHAEIIADKIPFVSQPCLEENIAISSVQCPQPSETNFFLYFIH